MSQPKPLKTWLAAGLLAALAIEPVLAGNAPSKAEKTAASATSNAAPQSPATNAEDAAVKAAGKEAAAQDAAAAAQSKAAGSDEGYVSADSAAPSDSGGEPFDIWEIQVEGNTLLPTKDIERSVYSHLGPKKSIEDVESARKQLEQLYQARGYGTVFVDIPEQDVIGGVVRLKVTEGQVERLRVTGSRYFSLGRIKSKVPSLAKDSVPNLPKVQEELVALNKRSSDRSITPVLRPGKTPGKVEVELKVADNLPLHGSVEINDKYSADTTRLRIDGNIRYDNLWQKEHSVSISYQTSPMDPAEVEVFSGTYLWKFEDRDDLLALYAVKSDTNVATIGTLGVIGNGVIGGVRYIKPLQSLDGYFHNLTLGADYKDFSEAVQLLGADSLNTPINYLLFDAGYSGTWLKDDVSSHFNANVNFAPRALGNIEKEFENKRFKAKPNFAYLRMSGDHSEPLGAGAALFGRLSGQLASGPLISNEQFGAGGADSVRGYLESQALGDDGISGTLELRSPPFGKYLGLKEDKVQNLQAVAFTDAAQTRIRSPLPAQRSDTFIWGTGAGLRAAIFHHFDAELMWAYPLREAGTVHEGESRFHFNFGYEF